MGISLLNRLFLASARLRLFRFLCLVTILCLQNRASVHAAGIENSDELLRKLSAIDQTYFSNLSISGSDISIARGFSDELEDQRVKWRFTTDGHRKIVVINSLELPQPRKANRQPLSSSLPNTDQTKVGLPLRNVLFFCPSFSAQIATFVSPSFAGRDPTTFPGADAAWAVQFYGPDDLALTLPLKKILWSMGRGFAAQIDAIDSLSSTSDGLLRLVAKGRATSPWPGVWEIDIDPQTAYMARSAKFTKQGDKIPIIEIKASGSRYINGRWIPQNSTWTDRFGTGVERVSPVTFFQLSSSADLGLLDETQRTIQGPYPGAAIVTDHRGPPSAVTLNHHEVYRGPVDTMLDDSVHSLSPQSTATASPTSPDATALASAALGTVTAQSHDARFVLLTKNESIGMFAGTVCVACFYLGWRIHRRKAENG